MLGEDVESVEKALGVGLCYESLREPWLRIKAAIVEPPKTAYNSAITQCPFYKHDAHCGFKGEGFFSHCDSPCSLRAQRQ
jgi:hypothetical protein